MRRVILLKPSFKRFEIHSKMCRCVASEAWLWLLPAIAAEALGVSGEHTGVRIKAQCST
jgi:hypothetical protein